MAQNLTIMLFCYTIQSIMKTHKRRHIGAVLLHLFIAATLVLAVVPSVGASEQDADAKRAEELRARVKRGEPLFRSQQQWLEEYESREQKQTAEPGSIQEARNLPRFAPGWRETQWSEPCREFTLTGRYQGPDWSFYPDADQADEKGVFWPFRFYRFRRNLRELTENRKAPSGDPDFYQDKRLKISVMASARHPDGDKNVHRFGLVWLTSIEVID